MAYFLRFTERQEDSKTKSTDWFKKEEVDGVYAYDISDFVEDMQSDGYDDGYIFLSAVREQAATDNSFLKNENGKFIIFDGSETGVDNRTFDFEGKNAVVAKITDIDYVGAVVFDEEANAYYLA